VDVTAQVIKDQTIWTRAATALLADPQIGSLAMLAVPGSPRQAMDKVDALLPAVIAAGKPAVVAALGDDSPVPKEFFSAFRDKGIPVFRSPERALRALAHATAYGRVLATRDVAPAAMSAAPALPRRGVVPEFEAKAYLSALGIPVPRGRLARDPVEALAVAEEIGFPVALKAQASRLSHKSDVGGVRLAIGDNAALEATWRTMQDDMARAGIALEGILVEAMGRPGLEMVLGARRDPDWGPVVMIGLGGIWIEALNDVRLMPADLPREQVIGEFARLSGAAVLRGLRGQKPADIDALADAAVRIGALMQARPEIAEVDINPLAVYPQGEGVLALDALIVADT
jgi:acyl-CoA synthetase (NDP forming)